MSDEKVFYADQPGALVLGGSVARLSFGVASQNDDELKSVVTIAMPIESLVMLINDLSVVLNGEQFKTSTVAALRNAIAAVEKGVDGELSSSLKKARSRRPTKKAKSEV